MTAVKAHLSVAEWKPGLVATGLVVLSVRKTGTVAPRWRERGIDEGGTCSAISGQRRDSQTIDQTRREFDEFSATDEFYFVRPVPIPNRRREWDWHTRDYS